MKCNNALDTIYLSNDFLSLGKRFALAIHIIFCGKCAASFKNFEESQMLLHTGFFPPSPDFSDSIMDIMYKETVNEAIEEDIGQSVFESGGFSTRSWVIAGIIMLVSFATVYLGQDFNRVAADQGLSFLLPLGIITGLGISAYGALFIGSHLKELSERFKL